MNAPRRQPVTTIALVTSAVTVCALATVLLFQSLAVAAKTDRAQHARQVSDLYADARFQLSQQESEEGRYLDAPKAESRARFAHSATRLAGDLRRLRELEPASQAVIDDLRADHARFTSVVSQMLAAADMGDHERVERLDEGEADPAFDELEQRFNAEATTATLRADRLSTDADAALRRNFRAGAVTVVVGVAIFIAMGLLLRRERRRVAAAWEQELVRLAAAAMTDALTGLRNHRAFQEDLSRELLRVSRSELPLAVMLLDLDDLKALNDAEGHQAGDERLRAFADMLRTAIRGADCAYRTGGDEFAVILPGTGAAGAVELAQRIHAATEGFTATAGIAEALEPRHRDDVLHEAGLALLAARRIHQPYAIFTKSLRAVTEAPDEHHTRVLAGALARAVDAKDSYTRSHCQTVSHLASAIAAELGIEGERLERIRVAGLLHDVGKIGIPDAILNKPAALTDEEYELMKGHALLGYDIVDAAGLSAEARWIRHHHERVDGGGYPDGLVGEQIPLESRIILVADAFEAMMSDRPYRKAPGRRFALEELRRGAGTQFDATVVAALERALATVPIPV